MTGRKLVALFVVPFTPGFLYLSTILLSRLVSPVRSGNDSEQFGWFGIILVLTLPFTVPGTAIAALCIGIMQRRLSVFFAHIAGGAMAGLVMAHFPIIWGMAPLYIAKRAPGMMFSKGVDITLAFCAIGLVAGLIIWVIAEAGRSRPSPGPSGD